MRRHPRPMRWAIVVAITMMATFAEAAGQAEPGRHAAVPVTSSEADERYAQELHADGVRVETPLLVAWFSRQTPEDVRQRVLHIVSTGIPEIIRFLKLPRPWQPGAIPRLEYYFPNEGVISHVNRQRQLFISATRIQNGSAPLLHETVHALAAPVAFPADTPIETIRASRPLWLIEGLAELTAKTLSKATGLDEGDVHNLGPIDQIDMACRERLSDDQHQVLTYLGRAGSPAALSDRNVRATAAPVFYACAASFVKFLVERYGLETVVDLLGQTQPSPALERSTGETVDAVRRAWERSIGRVSPQP